jgi:chromosome segregation ATPase
MNQRFTSRGFLSMMDSNPATAGLLAYSLGRRWLRDSGGHGAGGSDDDSDPPGSEGDDDEEDDDEEDEDVKGKNKKSDDDDEDETVSKRQYDKLHRRMTAADQRSSNLQKELDDVRKKMEDGSKEVPDELRKEVADLRTKAEKANDENRSLKVRIAFLTTSVKGITWKDSDAALKLVDLSDVDIDDKGNVDVRDLRAALKQLAKDKPYLLADKEDKDEDDSKDDTDQRSGPSMNSTRKGSKKTKVDQAALQRRFPALGATRGAL